ncbi:hypothetical protein V6S67_18320 [Arthrobacter sp. Soc17.1.1.1]|uniref:hypothetical protein n=1 Tax=Arthrobacter sp. Soc17.1.1.1 TaxID=3121277 RepID=UPI002FE42FCC
MPTLRKPSLISSVTRGMAAGVAGTVVMTAFQKFVEMPLTGRKTSYAPADFAARILPIHTRTQQGRDQLNWVTHFGLGTMWGSAYGITAHAGLRGAKVVAVVFPVVYAGDVLLNTALGLYKPSTWTGQDWAVDIINKFVQAAATGILHDHVFRPDTAA